MMTTRTIWKDQYGFEVTGFEIAKHDDGRWHAKAVGRNARKQQGIYLIATKERQATHASEYEAAASMIEWMHT